MKRESSTIGLATLMFIVAMDGYAQTTFTKVTASPVVSDGVGATAAVWVDFDNDRDLDLYVSARQSPVNLFYRNDGNGLFTPLEGLPPIDIGGNSFSSSWADFDNNGRDDLFVGRSGAQGLLFRQQIDGTFTRQTLPLSSSLGGSWADYDNDGFLDLIIADDLQTILWHNDRNGNLTRGSNSGIDASGSAIAWADYDSDGDADVLIAESPFSGAGNSRLYRNNGNGTFTRITAGHIAQRTANATGISWGDYNNDGYLDLMLARGANGQNLASFLFRNNGDGTFTQVEEPPFTTDTGFSLGGSWGDYDNDGWLDLFLNETDGGINRLYRNKGDGTFERIFSDPFGIDSASSAGCVWGDYDRDGFLDLFVATQGDDLLYHNNGNTHAWLVVRCVGTRSNRSAIGAKVRVKAMINGKTFWQLREINTGDGWVGNPLEAHFGLGDATNAETLRIEWPSGMVQEFQNVAGKRYLTVTEPSRLVAASSKGVPQLTLQGGRNLQYDIQTSSDLTAWSPLGAITITNLDGTAEITDANAPSSGARFYRAVLR